MTYVDELIRTKPELKSLKACIGNALADNYVRGLRGRYYTRLDRGIQVATRTKPDQLASVIEQLLADREKRGGGAPFSIHDVGDSEQLMRTLILGLWTSRAVAPSCVNGTVQVKSKAVYGDENYIPSISLEAISPAGNPVSEPSAIVEPAPAESSSVSEMSPAGTDIVDSDSLADQFAAGSSHVIRLDEVEALQAYINRAEEIFLHPAHQYTWNEIVTGAMVSIPGGGELKYMAVDRNTFRGFHKIDKSGVGAGVVFRDYFVRHRDELVSALETTRTVDDLHALLNRVSDDIREGLVNIKPSMLASYNKIRKPVDLYTEHLVTMARELDASREQLIPLISLPLDSQMFEHPDVFQDAELRKAGVSRRSTYMEVSSEATYRYLQGVLRDRAKTISQAAGLPFHPIYFDLLWNNRHARPGTNLFELNP